MSTYELGSKMLSWFDWLINLLFGVKVQTHAPLHTLYSIIWTISVDRNKNRTHVTLKGHFNHIKKDMDDVDDPQAALGKHFNDRPIKCTFVVLREQTLNFIHLTTDGDLRVLEVYLKFRTMHLSR